MPIASSTAAAEGRPPGTSFPKVKAVSTSISKPPDGTESVRAGFMHRARGSGGAARLAARFGADLPGADRADPIQGRVLHGIGVGQGHGRELVGQAGEHTPIASRSDERIGRPLDRDVSGHSAVSMVWPRNFSSSGREARSCRV